MVQLWLLPRRLLLRLVDAYQHTLSPDHGPLQHLFPYGYCRHHPTCSDYAKEKLQERGAMVGSLLATKRLLSCHPWAKVSDQKVQWVPMVGNFVTEVIFRVEEMQQLK